MWFVPRVTSTRKEVRSSTREGRDHVRLMLPGQTEQGGRWAWRSGQGRDHRAAYATREAAWPLWEGAESTNDCKQEIIQVGDDGLDQKQWDCRSVERGGLRIFKRPRHVIDDLMGRIGTCKGAVPWMGALSGGSVSGWGGGVDERNFVSWPLAGRWGGTSETWRLERKIWEAMGVGDSAGKCVKQQFFTRFEHWNYPESV